MNVDTSQRKLLFIWYCWTAEVPFNTNLLRGMDLPEAGGIGMFLFGLSGCLSRSFLASAESAATVLVTLKNNFNNH